MTYDTWKAQELGEDIYGPRPEPDDPPDSWDSRESCPRCGFMIRDGERPHEDGELCRPEDEGYTYALVKVTCPICSGTGVDERDHISMCTWCPGTGTIYVVDIIKK